METGLRSRLDGLPDELLESILDYIVAPSDLAVCLQTCRALNRLALPRLYHTLHLTATYESAVVFARDCGVGERTNPGLKYVREATLDSAPCWYLDTNLWAWIALRLVELFPEGQLKRFVRRSHDIRFISLASTLWQNQPNLRNVDFFDMEGDESCDDCDRLSLSDYMKTITWPSMQMVEQIRITPCTSDYLIQWGLQLRHAPNISDLEYDARYYRSPMGITQQEEAPYALHLLLDTWLRPEGRHAKRKPELARLRITDINMWTAGHIWFDYFSLDNISCLSLEICPGVANFLVALRSNDLRSLRKLEIIHLGTTSLTTNDTTVESIDELLMHIKPGTLQDLILRLHRAENKRPSTTAINRHASSLRTLVLDITGNRDIYESWSGQSLQGILDGCDTLLELATSIIPFSVEDCESNRAGNTENTSFNLIRAIFDCCPRLKTLNLLNWPCLCANVPYWRDAHALRGELDPISLSAMLPLAKHVAAFIFELHRDEYDGGLEVLALGAREYGKPLPKYFVPCEEVIIRKKTLSAGLVTLKQLKHEGMRTSVLDYEWIRYVDRGDTDVFEYPWYLEDERELQELQKKVERIKEGYAESAEGSEEETADGETVPAEGAAAAEDVDMAMAD
ncbi:hypothetical protein EJ03DRAFT_354104 [Teratosphaeria nubilosa]|uniref:F-box domain-containing protein n=1 Tax=Teratosphaeria nubilosa TaxID=161662 RepID=A0A6G1L164_9PEZI|nr:hypothetical protein EJ03DRAFT_354104 [Teratosphaeria nubilosa]